MFSKLERFQPEKTSGPPVGAYNPKYPPKLVGPVSFKRSPREKSTKFHGPAVGQYDPKYPDYKVKSVVDLSKSRNESFGTVSYLKPPAKVNHKLNKLKRRSQSADQLNSIDNNHDRTIEAESVKEDDEKENLMFRLSQQSEELSKKEKELQDLRNKLFKLVSESEQKKNEIQSRPTVVSISVSTDVDNSEALRIQRVNDLFSELSVLKQDRDKIKFESESLRSEIFSLLPELNKQVSLANGLVTDTNSFRNGFNELCLEHDVLKQKFIDVQMELDKKINELHIFRMNNSILSQDVANFMKEIENLKVAEIKATSENEILRRDFQTIEVRLLDKVSTLETDLNEAKQTIQFWIELKIGFDKIIAESDEQMAVVVGENEILREKLNSLSVSFHSLTDQLRFLNEDRVSSHEELKLLELETVSALEMLKAKVRALNDIAEKLNHEKEELDKENKAMLLVIEEKSKSQTEELERFTIIESRCLHYEEELQRFKKMEICLNEELAAIKVEKITIEQNLVEQRHQFDSLTDENLRLSNDNRNLIDQALKLCDQNDLLHREKLELEENLKVIAKSNEENVSHLRITLNEVKNELQSLNLSHANLCQRYDRLNSQKNVDVEQKFVSLKTENSKLLTDVASSVDEIKRLKKINEAASSDLQISHQETLRYKSQLDDLVEKIKPFKEQLDLYQSERNVLNARENEYDEAMKALLEKYASLLSHQNQKQKIHHINKLKDEILKLRHESRETSKENAKLKCQMESLQEKLAKHEGKRRFDPKMAFNFGEKENQPLKSLDQNL